ncbi:MAG: hypothetical protein ACLUDD_04990 [Lactobacillus kalixensis]|uniref:hypothetical protein n=1 Tax=Lactobacillus kalixensis TaxID=227944 RepID=UPI0039940B28
MQEKGIRVVLRTLLADGLGEKMDFISFAAASRAINRSATFVKGKVSKNQFFLKDGESNAQYVVWQINDELTISKERLDEWYKIHGETDFSTEDIIAREKRKKLEKRQRIKELLLKIDGNFGGSNNKTDPLKLAEGTDDLREFRKLIGAND